VIARSGVDPEAIETVIAGCLNQVGEQGANIARNAWLHEGLPVGASAQTIDSQCGSAQQAVGFAAALIAAGVHDVAVAGGVEHMGRVPINAAQLVADRFGEPYTPQLLAHHGIVGQGLAAELMADHWGLPRAALEELAVRSHRLAADAQGSGAFDREIVEVAGQGRDQGIRPDTSSEILAKLTPAFKSDGKITAGTASQISDGAAAVLLMSSDKAADLGLRARARIVDQVSVGCDPVMMLEGPIPATKKLLARNGMAIDDIDRIEINEAFASVVLAWANECAPDMSKVNVRGGAMALGHPLGSSGARLVTTLLHTLEDQDLEMGLVTMCCAGGLGTGTLVQRL
jgi:acetyl-CoA acyltransferase